jgi:hypothetical protein
VDARERNGSTRSPTRRYLHDDYDADDSDVLDLDFIFRLVFWCGPGSSVGLATVYGLDGPVIESQCGRDFPHLSRPALGPTQPPVQ